uniref:NADH dehydrogenase subunit 4L n=1 Tax=Tanaisia sp. SS-2020 TaxID=2780549 RepID=A0A894JM77_9TREM|nr:NADH dehydrogenase subunit 4L [Tanaisia sp. SS-2020]
MLLYILGILFIGLGLSVTSLVLCSSRLFNWLVVVENMNVLLLFVGLLGNGLDIHVLFIGLMVIFAVEVVLSLVVLVRLWDFGGFVGFLGY